MTGPPVFALLPTDQLRIHEEVEPQDVARLVEEIRRDGFVAEPIWVARGSHVVLNGHHRCAALRALGARLTPAWVFDYDSEEVVLGRWADGPPISKREVVERAVAGRPFPPKTTRHRLLPALPERRTPLAELGVPAAQLRSVVPPPATRRSGDGP